MSIPSPPTEPITHGRLLDFPEDPIGCMRRLQAEHGDVFALQEGSQKLVFALGPEYNQLVLSDPKRFHSRFFAIRGPRKSAHRRLTSGLLSMNGDEHRRHRRSMMGPFQKQAIGGYHDTVCQLVREMLDDWRVGTTIDANREMLHFMLRTTSAILFGVDEPEFAYHLGESIDEWVHLNHETGIGAFVPMPDFDEKYERLLAKAEGLEADLLELIDRRRRGAGDRTDVLSLLIRAYDEESSISDEQLSGHVALLFGAAHLTTAHTLAWTLFLLSQHPDVAAELQRESAASLTGDAPAIEALPSLTLTDQVIRESMRLLPASAYVQRVNAVPVEIGPLKLAPGTPIVWSQFMTHHRAELYPDPDRFLPQRWATIKPSPYEYLPFGAGPRMCIGGPLAMQILQTTLPMIVSRFRLQCVPHSRVDARVVSTTFGPAEGLPMTVFDANGRFEASPVAGNVHDLVRLDGPRPATRRAA